MVSAPAGVAIIPTGARSCGGDGANRSDQHRLRHVRSRIETELLCHLRAWRRGGAAIVTETVASVSGRPPLTVADGLEGQRAVFASPRRFRQRLQDWLMGLLLRLRYGRFVLAAEGRADP